MKIIYVPYWEGVSYLPMSLDNVILDVQVLETQGLLSQLALHAGIYHEVAPFPVRLVSYCQALEEYNKKNPHHLFSQSFQLDEISVAKVLLQWRDMLSLAGWDSQCELENCERLNTLLQIDAHYVDYGWPALLQELSQQMELMLKGEVRIPEMYRELEIVVPCPRKILPDYIQPLFRLLEKMGVVITEEADDRMEQFPVSISVIEFTQQWKAEAWLSQLEPTEYEVWINSNNKRLDNWLHMSGKPVGGSKMIQSNPQIVQLFLLSVQLFQRPLDVNMLLQYLYLPECPLDWELRNELAKNIVREGGFSSAKVLECIGKYIQDDSEREERYLHYLPFDLRRDLDSLVLESEEVSVSVLCEFLGRIRMYASQRVGKIESMMLEDVRGAQLREVVFMIDALLEHIEKSGKEMLPFSTLCQWAQSLYESKDFAMYDAQQGSRMILRSPSGMAGEVSKTIWCDCYGDVVQELSTGFLSAHELEQLAKAGVCFWNPCHEMEFRNRMLRRPLHYTTEKLTLVSCQWKGSTRIETHPLLFQLPSEVERIDGDELYKSMLKKDVIPVCNRREEDRKQVCFDAEKYPVKWRGTESFSSLEKLLQNPFDYFMCYTLGFTDMSATGIKLSLTYGNVAHDVVECLFTAEREGQTLMEFVKNGYQQAFNQALAKKGALLLLPAYHFDKDRLYYQLMKCVVKLADIIHKNGLTVVQCEKEEFQDLGLGENVMVTAYIDMLLNDKAGNSVVFDLKWTSKKDKHKILLENNRAAQLAIYRAMLEQHENHPDAVRTAFFVMPEGKLYSTESFIGNDCEQIRPAGNVDIMEQIRKGYAARVEEISKGRIETGGDEPISEIPYANVPGVFPLESKGIKRPKKEENKYSDYLCFTF